MNTGGFGHGGPLLREREGHRTVGGIPIGSPLFTLSLSLLVLLLLVASALTGKDGSASHASAADLAKPPQHGITLAYAGDSTTAKPDAWLAQLHDPRIRVVGGYAHSGYTSEQVLDHIHRVSADVVVVMVGINDFHFAASDDISRVIANVNQIVHRVHASRQIISAVAPSNITMWNPDGVDSQKRQNELNRALERDARAHHWAFVDPYSSIRDSKTGGYDAGYTLDGIHPTVDGYTTVTTELDAAIRKVARSLPASR